MAVKNNATFLTMVARFVAQSCCGMILTRLKRPKKTAALKSTKTSQGRFANCFY